ncbi:MAG: hypothetical protein AUK32_10245 [Candidatus Aquicultor secundus]|nr:MAG: hypothetical protein AUK32_10245 [Candidatus Aquicultor secundus]
MLKPGNPQPGALAPNVLVAGVFGTDGLSMKMCVYIAQFHRKLGQVGSTNSSTNSIKSNGEKEV